MYCTQELKLSEGEAYRRMQVAAVIDRFPSLLDVIERGDLTLTTASLLAPHLNKSNFEDLMKRCAKLPRRKVEFIVAGLAPKHLPFDVVRPLATPQAPAAEPRLGQTPSPDLEAPIPAATPGSVKVEPLNEGAARIHFTATRTLLDKLERARALLRHKYPLAEYNDIFDAALEALLERKDPDRKAAQAPKRHILTDQRRIPQWVKDEVWKRDGGRCAFVSLDGARCGETAWLEYDHVRPFALGGRSDLPENVRLLCRAHNQRAAHELFG